MDPELSYSLLLRNVLSDIGDKKTPEYRSSGVLDDLNLVVAIIRQRQTELGQEGHLCPPSINVADGHVAKQTSVGRLDLLLSSVEDKVGYGDLPRNRDTDFVVAVGNDPPYLFAAPPGAIAEISSTVAGFVPQGESRGGIHSQGRRPTRSEDNHPHNNEKENQIFVEFVDPHRTTS